MSPKTTSAPFATPAERRVPPRADLDTSSDRGRPNDSAMARWRSLEWIGLAAAVVATLVTYGFFLANPWPHGPLSEFLATFARGNAAVWPMQLVWYACAVVIVGLALWPLGSRRRSTLLICLLAAAYFGWEGFAYFGNVYRGESFALFWAAVFILEGMLFLVAGVARHDLTITPRWNRWDLASVLGAVFIGYALVGYPVIGLLGGHQLSTLPLFGLSPCATVVFAFGLLLWARPPAPIYLLPLLLAWAFGAAPPAMGTGVVVDIGMLVAAVITALVILWRDRTAPWQTITAGALLTLMVAWSGHEDVLMGIAVVLVAVTLVQAVRDTGVAPVALQRSQGKRTAPAGARAGER